MAISINGTSGISGVDGSAGTPALQGTDTNTGISFGTDEVNINTGGSTRATIDSSGRVLVGTSTARTDLGGLQPKLQVEGTSFVDSTISAVANSTAGNTAPSIVLAKSAGAAVGSNTLVGNNDVLGRIRFQGNDGSNFDTAAWIACEVDSTPGSDDMPGRLVFSTTANGESGPTERMRIKSDGTVTFGSNGSNDPIGSSFSGQLVLGPSGSAGAINYYNSSNPALKLGVGANGDIVTFFRNQPSATTVGSISVTTTATSYNTSSDYRLKENVVDLDGAIARLKQLAPKRFNFIADTETTVDGFLAHEAQTVVPEAVTGTHDEVDADGNPVYQGIDQSKLVPLLTAALQEALVKIETLETRLTALEGGTNP